MITPNYLNPGDTIAIVAPAKSIQQDKYPNIIKFIESKGYKVIRGKSTFLEHGPFAGTDDERRDDLQRFLNDPNIKAIFCLRGGYGTIRIIDDLDFSVFRKNPKWLIGFSDITILHSHINNFGIESLHAQMPINFSPNNDAIEKLFDVLSGKVLSYNLKPEKYNNTGSAEAEIIGGNLAILCSLIGTQYDINTNNKILFIEEVGEYLYKLDRMLFQLKQSGKLKNLKGLIIGGLTAMEDNSPKFPETAEEIIYKFTKQANYPVVFGFPAGHIANNFPLIFNRKAFLNVESNSVTLNF